MSASSSVAEVHTRRMLLRRMVDADLENLTRMHADPDVMRTLGGTRGRAQTYADLCRNLEHWRRHGFGYWAALLEGDVADRPGEPLFVGRGGLRRLSIAGRDEVEVGYAFVPDHQGRGLATELARAAVRVAFDVLALPDLVCFALPDNTRSRRVMEKVGFRYEREFEYADRKHVLYRLTREQHGRGGEG